MGRANSYTQMHRSIVLKTHPGIALQRQRCQTSTCAEQHFSDSGWVLAELIRINHFGSDKNWTLVSKMGEEGIRCIDGSNAFEEQRKWFCDSVIGSDNVVEIVINHGCITLRNRKRYTTSYTSNIAWSIHTQLKTCLSLQEISNI